MKKLLSILILICAGFVGSAHAQQTLTAASTDCTKTSSCMIVPVSSNQGGATFTISGTFSATMQFEASGDNETTWVALTMYPSNSTTGASSATAAGTWQANIAGYTNLRIRVSTYGSGSVIVNIRQSTASASSGHGGGGGSGTVTNTGTLTSGHCVIGNGTVDIKVDTGCTTDGAGAMTLTVPSTNDALTIKDTTATGVGTGQYFTINDDGSFSTINLDSASNTTGVFFNETYAGALAEGQVGILANAGLGVSGPITAPSITLPAAGGVAGGVTCTAGTAIGHATASTVTMECPATATAYEMQYPTAAATGILHTTNSSGVVAQSISAVVDADLSGTVGVAHGGTALATLTAHALYAGNAASAPNPISVGATGTVLAGSTGADPAFTATPAVTTIATGTSPPTCTPGTGGVFCANEGTASTGAASVDQLYADSTNHCLTAINNNLNSGCVISAPAAPAAITIGSGSSIGSTSLCASAICTAGLYAVHAYLDITTACGTSGTYLVSLIYTDDQGSKTIPINLSGTGAVPATGVVTTTSTANFGENVQVIRSTGAAAINYSTTAVACGTAGPMVGKLYLAVVRISTL